MQFRDLPVGATFDFVDDSRPGYNSFFARCIKTGPRRYSWVGREVHTPEGLVAQHLSTRVGSINVNVHHVEQPVSYGYRLGSEHAAGEHVTTDAADCPLCK